MEAVDLFCNFQNTISVMNKKKYSSANLIIANWSALKFTLRDA